MKDRKRSEWSEPHRKQVKAIFALVIGSFIILAGIVFLGWEVMTREVGIPLDKLVLSMGGGLIAVGLIAAMPGTFIPVFSWVVQRIPFFSKNGIPPIKTPTGTMIGIPPLTDEKEKKDET